MLSTLSSVRSLTRPLVSTSTNTLPTVTDTSVYLLIDGDGVNNGTTFKDRSSYNRTVSRSGSITTSNAYSKYTGMNTIKADVTGYLTTTLPAIGTRDFTVECFVMYTSFNASYSYFVGSTNLWIGVQGNGFRILWFGGTIGANVTCNLNQWYHFAVSRVNGTLYQHIDGVAVHVRTGQTNNLTDTAFQVSNSSYKANGYLAGVRVTVGKSQYTSANFTPPSTPFV